jgi:hypothetical protein
MVSSPQPEGEETKLEHVSKAAQGAAVATLFVAEVRK